jgi:hypothetical protein
MVDSAEVLAEFGKQMRRDPAAEPGADIEREQRVTRIISSGGGWSGVLWSDLAGTDADAVIGAQVSRAAGIYRAGHDNTFQVLRAIALYLPGKCMTRRAPRS